MTGAFVGRDQELDALIAESAIGDGRVALVSGEAGIGKTRLADEISRRLAARGWAVAWGRSWEGQGTPAFWPWLQVFRSFITLPRLGASFEEVRRTSVELAELLAPGSSGSGASQADPELARFRLLEASAAALRRMAEESPLLIVLDDLHAADVSTLLLLRFLARDLRGSPIFFVATSRDLTHRATEATARLLADVARDAVHVPLGRLARADIATWMGAVAPRLASRAEAVFNTSEGNPLFVEELLAAATKRPDASWMSTQHMPLGIREAIRRHLEVLSPAARELLEAASAIGREFSLPVAHRLVSCSYEEALELASEGVAAGAMADLGEDRFRFAHVLLRDDLYARLGERRAALHRAIAVKLADEPAVAAEHWLLGARPEDAEAALSAVRAAAAEARCRLAFEDAARLGERALSVLGPHLPQAEAAELWMMVGEGRTAAGEEATSQQAFTRAAEIAASLSNGELLARAALASVSESSMRRNDTNIAILRRALAALPARDSAIRARVMARLSSALLPPLPHEAEEFQALAAEAVAMARRVGDDSALFFALRLKTEAFPETLGASERLAANSESIALGLRLGQAPRIAPLLAWQVAGRLELGDPDGADRELAGAEELLSRLPQARLRWRAPLARALRAAIEGRFEEATALQREVRRIADEHDLIEARIFLSVHRVGFQYIRGDNDGFDEFDELVRSTLRGLPLQDVFSALPHAIAGRVDEARVALDRLREMPIEGIPGMGALAWACARARLTEHAGFFYEFLRGHPAKCAIMFGPGGLTTMGPTLLVAGQLAALLGRNADAVAHHGEALLFARRIRSRPFVAQCELGLAQALAPTDAKASREHAGAAASIARDLGMRGVREQAEKLAAPAGSASPSPVRSAEAASLRLARSGDLWSLSARDASVMLKDTKGLAYLETLVLAPHREVHALELVGGEDGGDAGPLLDERAKRMYRERAESLRGELDEATRHGDLGRAERMREELEALGTELTRALGLGGRDRRAASPAERARINVQRRLKDVIRRVRDADETLGSHLELSVRTGIFCIYSPTWPG